MADYQEGQTATNPKTGQKIVFKGGQWVNAGGAIPGGPKLSPQDRTALNGLRDQSAAGLDALGQYKRAAGAIARLGTGPSRAMWLDARIPDENDGILGRIGSAALGWTVPQTDIDDFQRLKGLQSGRVLNEQLGQKGPQTESDAARLQLTEISPYKSVAANRDVVRFGALKAAAAVQKTPFYTKWANAHGGINGVDAQGRTVDEVWSQIMQDAQHRAEMRAAGQNPDDPLHGAKVRR